MSRYVTCREAKISPKFSDCKTQYAYEPDYLLVEFTGKPKKTYYEKTEVQICSIHNKKWCVVFDSTSENEDNGYICIDWLTAKSLREHLLKNRFRKDLT